jgi:hypothetical protein
MDSDPDPAIFVIDIQNKKLFFLKISCLLPVLFAVFGSQKEVKKTVGIKDFCYYFSIFA